MKSSTWKQPRLLLLAFWLVRVVSAWAQPPVELRDFSVSRTPNGFPIELLPKGPLQAKVQMLSSPDRIVIDLIGAASAESLRRMSGAEGDRIVDFRSGPLPGNLPMARLVANLDKPSDFDLSTKGSRLLISVHPLRAGSIGRQAATASVVPQPRARKRVSSTPSKPVKEKPVEVHRNLLFEP